jgi:DNA-binding transcriptional regulator YdaS (Cro superfamily)
MSQDTPNRKALRDVVKALGGQVAAAARFGVSQPTVSRWLELPAEHVLRAESLTGIPRGEIRPDIYPLESGAQGAGSPPASMLDGAGGASAAERHQS